MKKLCFNSFMSSEVLLQQSVFPEITNGHQAFNVISGHRIPIEWAIIALFFFLAVYMILRCHKRLSIQEQFRLATEMAYWLHAPLVLLRNSLEEIMEGSVSGDSFQMLEPLLEYAECVIAYHRNMIRLNKGDWKALSEIRTTQVEIHNYIQLELDRCKPYAVSHHVRMEISHSKGRIGCGLSEGLIAVAIHYLVHRMIDSTAPEGCIYAAVSHDTEVWKLQISNDKNMKSGTIIHMLRLRADSGLRAIGKIIRLHSGKMRVHRHRESVVCKIIVPINCHCKKNTGSDSNILFRRYGGYGEVTDTGKKDYASRIDQHPYVLLVTADNMFGNYLQKALSGEFNIKLQSTLDIRELVETRKGPDAIIVDEHVEGTCGDELCSRIKAEETTSSIPLVLLAEHGDCISYLSHARSGADRLMLRTTGICNLKTDIRMLINSYNLLRKQVVRPSETVISVSVETEEKDDAKMLFINKVRQVIEEHLDIQRYTIDMLCAEMGMSRTGFYNKMKEFTGKCPTEYVVEFKMERAKMLLGTGRYSVTEIAEMLGYCDAKYFGKKFKYFYHVCPTKFIKNTRQNNSIMQ